MSHDTSTQVEEWRDIPGYEGYYQVSDHGRVRSVDREYVRSDGRKYFLKGKVLNQTTTLNGYKSISLRRGGRKHRASIHRMVLLAFLGACPPGMEACHSNGVRDDNRLSNLRWDTGSENKYDTIKHGKNRQVNKTHCPRGHLLKAPNLRARRKSGKVQHRECLSCSRARTTIRNRNLPAGLMKSISDSNYVGIMAARKALEEQA